MSLDRGTPYNELPPLPPKVAVETRPVLKKAVTAARSLAELKGLGGVIPDQVMLVNSLVLQEAKASSEIDRKPEYSRRLLEVTENQAWEASAPTSFSFPGGGWVSM